MKEDAPRKLGELRDQLSRVILGKPEAIDHVLVALLAGQHLLLEDVPGVGKTTLAKALARAFSGAFRRVQFTPDLLPADILGASVYNPKDGSFSFKEGPVFANVLLADEVNRASPRTQSALLEAMSEGQVSSEGVTRALPAPFLVLATQNPVEFHGTYPLPEAQLDRFGVRVGLGYPAAEAELEVLYSQAGRHPLEAVEAVLATQNPVEFHGTYPLPEAQLDRFGVRLGLGYPAAEAELEVLYSQAGRHPLEAVTAVLSAADVTALQAAVREVRIERSLGRYVVALAEATRRHPQVRLGCSPRGSLMLFRAAQARALLEGRAFVVPEDVKAQAVPVLAHRLGLETKARYTGVSKEELVREVLDAVPVPA